jgi:ferredoxin
MPDVFEADERGRVVLLVDGQLPADLLDHTRVAVLNCPEQALRLIE